MDGVAELPYKRPPETGGPDPFKEDYSTMDGGFYNWQALVSSDWNECLCQSTPFDPISFLYPEISPRLETVFKKYTGNIITLGQAVKEVMAMLPEPLSPSQMDAYLEASFRPYKGVIDLIRWCLENRVLFLINTTAFQGYFQRALVKGLIPQGVVVAANPSIRYEDGAKTSLRPLDINEIEDKPSATRLIMEKASIPARRLIVIGDSGGDGPHFEWGASVGAYLIGSMTKPSLDRFCRDRNVTIDLRFGLDYSREISRDPEAEMTIDYMELSNVISRILQPRRG